MTSLGGARVSAIMHDTTDLDSTVAFWKAMLGLDELFRDERYVYLEKMSENGPHLAFQKVPEPKAMKNRLHLDVRAPDRLAFIEKAVAMGGTHVGDHQEGDFPLWSVMTDPEGNEFCLYQTEADAS